MNDEMLILIAYCKMSSYRVRVIKAINDEVLIPKEIAKISGLRPNHTSKVFKELKTHGVLECINEEARKGRLYRLTDTGKTVVANL